MTDKNSQSTDVQSDLRPDLRIVIPAALVVLFVCIPFVTHPQASNAVLNAMFSFLSEYLGSYYLWFTLFLAGLAAFFTFSRYGNVKFGAKDEKPAFTDFQWVSMMFCAGVAGAVMYWSIAEPLFNLRTPPMGATPFSPEAYKWSTAYVLFHWGPLTWVWYAICALPICFMYYKRQRPVLRISSACEPLLGEKHSSGLVGRVIDIFFVIGLIASNAAVMGISVPIVAQALSTVFGIEPTLTLQLLYLAFSACIFTASVAMGLEKGAARLANANVVIAIAVIIYAFVVGPTNFIIKNFTNAVGTMLGNYFQMSLSTEPHTASTFPQDWTIFYALWMASYGPFMGLFIARISKGRTIRQIVSMGVVFGMLGSWMIHGVFGGYTLYMQLHGGFDAAQYLVDNGPIKAVVAVLATLPLANIVLLAYCMFSTIFLATSLDASAYTLAASCTRRLKMGENPSVAHRFFWAIVSAALPAALLFIGGIEPMKTFGNVSGALMILVIVPLVLSLFKMIKEEDPIALKYPEIYEKMQLLEKMQNENTLTPAKEGASV